MWGDRWWASDWGSLRSEAKRCRTYSGGCDGESCAWQQPRQRPRSADWGDAHGNSSGFDAWQTWAWSWPTSGGSKEDSSSSSWETSSWSWHEYDSEARTTGSGGGGGGGVEATACVRFVVEEPPCAGPESEDADGRPWPRGPRLEAAGSPGSCGFSRLRIVGDGDQLGDMDLLVVVLLVLLVLVLVLLSLLLLLLLLLLVLLLLLTELCLILLLLLGPALRRRPLLGGGPLDVAGHGGPLGDVA